MKRILCILITAIWLCTCWAGNGKKPIVWEQPIAESNQIFNDPFQSQLNIYRVEFADDETRVFMHITFRPHPKISPMFGHSLPALWAVVAQHRGCRCPLGGLRMPV